MPPAPPNWDEESVQLRHNLVEALHAIRTEAKVRPPWSSKSVRKWHITLMRGLELRVGIPKNAIGRFRGQGGLEGLGVRIASREGVRPARVADAFASFDKTLRQCLSQLDVMIPADEVPSRDLLLAVIDVCAWAHAEWVRIHPFANGNGRMARLLANGIAMRYGLPVFIRLRPRPDGDYSGACAAAMRGEWRPTADVFGEMLKETLPR